MCYTWRPCEAGQYRTVSNSPVSCGMCRPRKIKSSRCIGWYILVTLRTRFVTASTLARTHPSVLSGHSANCYRFVGWDWGLNCSLLWVLTLTSHDDDCQAIFCRHFTANMFNHFDSIDTSALCGLLWSRRTHQLCCRVPSNRWQSCAQHICRVCLVSLGIALLQTPIYSIDVASVAQHQKPFDCM